MSLSMLLSASVLVHVIGTFQVLDKAGLRDEADLIGATCLGVSRVTPDVSVHGLHRLEIVCRFFGVFDSLTGSTS